MTSMLRVLGRSGIHISAMGLGCWAIGGSTSDPGVAGWGDVDDRQTLRALETALDLGITLFDTAPVYGAGHSEEMLGRAFAGRRSRVVISTKFRPRVWAGTQAMPGDDFGLADIEDSVKGSLRRLATDYIDLLLLHRAHYPLAGVDSIVETLENLVSRGLVRWFGWSTDDHRRAAAIGRAAHCCAIEQHLNVLGGSTATLEYCESAMLASINRGPLQMGILGGHITPQTSFAPNDLRHQWDLRTGAVARRLQQANALRDVLTSAGRTMAQGALAWLWARSTVTVPIPGFTTVAEVKENAQAMAYGALSQAEMSEIELILVRGGVA
jgi:aryl-alcohol dehydrogenase-like predicted oxidoreductase